MRARLQGTSGWVAALLIAVIGMPSTAMAVTLIDGKYIKPGTVKAKQLDPLQRSEAFSAGIDSADLPLSSTAEVVALRAVPPGTYVVHAQINVSNFSGAAQAVACYLDGDAAVPTVFRGLTTGGVIDNGVPEVFTLVNTAKVSENDTVALKCMTLGNPANVEMEQSFLLLERVAKNTYLPLT